jgi:hypothetical protein
MPTPWADALRGTNIAKPRTIALRKMADDFLMLVPLKEAATIAHASLRTVRSLDNAIPEEMFLARLWFVVRAGLANGRGSAILSLIAVTKEA